MALEEKPKYDFDTALALNVIVRHILADLASDGERVSEMWENYPEIGEHDWIAICGYVEKAAQPPDVSQFKAAYEHLSARADH